MRLSWSKSFWLALFMDLIAHFLNHLKFPPALIRVIRVLSGPTQRLSEEAELGGRQGARLPDDQAGQRLRELGQSRDHDGDRATLRAIARKLQRGSVEGGGRIGHGREIEGARGC